MRMCKYYFCGNFMYIACVHYRLVLLRFVMANRLLFWCDKSGAPKVRVKKLPRTKSPSSFIIFPFAFALKGTLRCLRHVTSLHSNRFSWFSAFFAFWPREYWDDRISSQFPRVQTAKTSQNPTDYSGASHVHLSGALIISKSQQKLSIGK